jgi:hypothetical protein
MHPEEQKSAYSSLELIRLMCNKLLLDRLGLLQGNGRQSGVMFCFGNALYTAMRNPLEEVQFN